MEERDTVLTVRSSQGESKPEERAIGDDRQHKERRDDQNNLVRRISSCHLRGMHDRPGNEIRELDDGELQPSHLELPHCDGYYDLCLLLGQGSPVDSVSECVFLQTDAISATFGALPPAGATFFIKPQVTDGQN